jgi:hypothetical protein
MRSASLLDMSTHAPATVSAEELLKLPSGEGKRYELVEGRLQVMCAAVPGWRVALADFFA